MVTELMESIKDVQSQLQENSDRISEGMRIRFIEHRSMFYVVTALLQFTASSSLPSRHACAPCRPFSTFL